MVGPICDALAAKSAPFLVGLGVLLSLASPSFVRRAHAASVPAAQAGASSDTTGSRWDLELHARGDVGYDTNVFQQEDAQGDAFSRLSAVAGAERERGAHRLSARAELSRKFYRELSRADELEAFGDLEAARDLGRLTAGVAVRSAYLDLRLFDREGNLLPRTTFASWSNRFLAFGDLELTRDLYVAAEGGYRLKDYEETAGLSSLDYGEWSGEVEVTRYFPKRISVRLATSLEDRAYHERRAADASGASDPANPDLHLRRVEGELRARKRWGDEGLAEVAGGLRESKDLFEDELTYVQRSAGLRVRHGFGAWLLALRAGFTNRDFKLRRSGTGEALREDFVTLDADVERLLWRGTRVTGGYRLFERDTNDVLGGYTLGTVQLGIVHAF